MIKRKISQAILKLKNKYPVISITGPRQSGKTTLAKKLFKNYQYYNLESLDLLSAAKDDPRGFLQIGSKKRLIIDEVQKYPDLLSYIQVETDTQQIPGQFIITGSQQFALNEKIAQSLAGRVANFTLLPFSIAELKKTQYSKDSHLKLIHRGFYPRIYDKKIGPKDFYRDYLFTYVERDVRQIKNVGNLNSFQKFLQLLAGRVGQLVNLSSLANDTSVSYKTIDSWLSILEASYITFSLQPYYKNFGKRLIKSPKIYFYDTGLLCYLLGLDSLKELKSHYALGSIFENLIITDVLKKIHNTRSSNKLYFWHDNNRNEVDLIIDKGNKKEGVEIKVSSTYSSDMLKGLNFWQNLSHQSKIENSIIYTGSINQKVKSINILNWREFLSLE